jgi:FixJ family two-component response regulator
MMKNSTVVIIDDDEAVRESLGWLLRFSGHVVAGYDSAVTYLNVGRKLGRPDCVVVDIHMPQMNGLECYQEIKGQFPDVPVVFITGDPGQTLAKQAEALEPMNFFAKPLDTQKLLSRINEAVTSSRVPYHVDSGILA